eukprot:SAG31_NODE_3301_length_4442_cov_17.276076_1_plen_325_part_00
MLQQLQQHLCRHHHPLRPTGTAQHGPRAISSASAAANAVATTSPDYVLLVNDDGPPDPQHSPFVGPFADHLASWAPNSRLAVCLPATQQSWRGKAHAPQEPLQVLSHQERPDWVLVTGTPAAAANYAVHHVGPDRFGGPASAGSRQPFVVSGPNLGDNSGRSYMLSSGTLGAALEAALSGRRAVALSFKRQQEPRDAAQAALEAAQVELASAAACRLLTLLWNSWPTTVDLYNVNIPLGRLQPGSDGCNAVYTTAASDSYGSVYPAGAAGVGRGLGDFSPQPRAAAAKGTDVWALQQGLISVTPLQARFAEATPAGAGAVLGRV